MDLDPISHAKFGLTYPATFAFDVPAGSSGLVGQYRFQATDAWISLPIETASDRFNGIPAARFDSAANRAYLSVPFSASSNSIFIRILNGAGQEVAANYAGIPVYYDNRHAAAAFTLDDVTTDFLPDFVNTVPLLSSKGLYHSVAIETGLMDAPSWATVQQWLNTGFTEAASHTRTHPCTDKEYTSGGGYTAQISGSRDDILANLSVPAHYVPLFVEPCGFESTSVRSAFLAAGYLADRTANTGFFNFAQWDASGGVYRPSNISYDTDAWPDGGGSATLRNQANAAFDQACSGWHLHVPGPPLEEAVVIRLLRGSTRPVRSRTV